MAHGYPGIVTPYNTAEFESMVRDVMAEFNANGQMLQVVGVDLRRELPKARNVSGRSGLMGADLRIAAWQVARQFGQAQAGQIASAAAVSKALQIYHGSFHGRSAGGTRARRFDAA
jgi:hypothetical protein